MEQSGLVALDATISVARVALDATITKVKRVVARVVAVVDNSPRKKAPDCG